MYEVWYACLVQVCGPDAAPDRRALLAIAELYSPRYQCRDDAIVVDVSGLTRLVGPPQVIAEEIARSARERGLSIHVAVAPTRTAAIVLAHARPGMTVVRRGDEANQLAQIRLVQQAVTPEAERGRARPRDVIAAWGASGGGAPRAGKEDSDQIAPRAGEKDIFMRWGLRTLGDIAALPGDQLAARMGSLGARWQAMARGEDREPFIPDLPEERFDASQTLEWPIEGLEPLSFVLTRLLEPLSARLAARDRGVAALHVRLHLVTREVHARRLELPAPLRDVKTLRTLALLDLESHPPDAAIDRVDVHIDPTPGRVLQHTLFSRAQPAPDEIATLVARLAALMGQDRVGAPAIVDTHRPGAFAMTSWTGDRAERLRPCRAEEEQIRGEASALVRAGGGAPAPVRKDDWPHASEKSWDPTSSKKDGTDPLFTALRRCRPPVPARVVADAGRPVRVTTDRRELPGGRVLRCTGPWRTSGHWWASETSRSRAHQREAEGRDRSVGGERGWGPASSNKRTHQREAEGRDRSVGGERGWAAFAKAPASVAEAERRPGPASSENGEAKGLRRPVLDTREGYGPSAPGAPRLRSGRPERESKVVGVGPHASKSWSHDEWDVALADGAAYRIFQDRETGGWFIDAIRD